MDDMSAPSTIDLTGLWIDDPAQVDAKLANVAPYLKPKLEKFIRDGYVVFEQVVPDFVIDQIIADTEACLQDPEKYVLRNAGQYIDAGDLETLGVGDRVIDLYGVSPAARTAIHAPILTEFLETIFEAPGIAMQSLSFQYGSQQAIHQDTAYVISKKPLHLAASWLALEDVVLGSGELIYYPGSHRFDHFLFDNEEKGWNKNKHGVDQHQEFLSQLHTQAKKLGLQQEHFAAKKGDVLVWHADLAHGGARITQPTQTRKSLVTHYCPTTVKPKFIDVAGDKYHQHEVKHPTGHTGYFASRHFDLEALDTQPAAPIYYDGGVSKRRVGG